METVASGSRGRQGLLAALFAGAIFCAPLAPLAFSACGASPTNLPQQLFLRIALLLIAVAWLGVAARAGVLRLRRTPFDLMLPAMAAWAGASLLWSVNPSVGVPLLLHWGCCILAFLLTVNLAARRMDLNRILFALYASGVVVALIGLGQHYFGIEWIRQIVPPASTFSNKNLAAQYVILTWPLGAALFSRVRTTWGMLLYGTSLVFQMAFLFHTFTKSCWLAAAVQVVLGALLLWRKRPFPAWNAKRVIVSVSCVAALFALMNLDAAGFSWKFGRATRQVIDTLDTKPASEQPDSPKVISLSARLDYWRDTLRLIENHPILGVGVGNFKIIYPQYKNRVSFYKERTVAQIAQSPHNDFLSVASELGFIGILLAGGFLVVLVRAAFRRLKHPPEDDSPLPGNALICALAGILVVACFSFPLNLAMPPFVFMVCLGCFCAGETGTPPRILVLPGTAAIAALCIFVPLLLLGAKDAWHARRADVHFARMLNAATPKQVLEEGAQVLAHDPGLHETLFHLSRAHGQSGAFDKAVELHRTFHLYHPYHMESRFDLVHFLIALQRHDEAMAVCNDLITAWPKEGIPHALKGQILTRQRKVEAAYREYRIALDLGGIRIGEIYFHFGNIAAAMKKYDEARMAFQESIRLSPSWLAYTNLAQLQLRVFGETAAGIENLRKAIELCPIPEAQEEFQRQLDELTKDDR